MLLERGRVRVLTRNGHDWTDRYPSIVLAAGDLPCKSAILDGEAVVQGANGVSDSGALASAMRWRPHTVILIQFSEGFQGDSAAFFNVYANKGLEGIVSKLATRRRCGKGST